MNVAGSRAGRTQSRSPWLKLRRRLISARLPLLISLILLRNNSAQSDSCPLTPMKKMEKKLVRKRANNIPLSGHQSTKREEEGKARAASLSTCTVVLFRRGVPLSGSAALGEEAKSSSSSSSPCYCCPQRLREQISTPTHLLSVACQKMRLSVCLRLPACHPRLLLLLLLSSSKSSWPPLYISTTGG